MATQATNGSKRARNDDAVQGGRSAKRSNSASEVTSDDTVAIFVSPGDMKSAEVKKFMADYTTLTERTHMFDTESDEDRQHLAKRLKLASDESYATVFYLAKTRPAVVQVYLRYIDNTSTINLWDEMFSVVGDVGLIDDIETDEGVAVYLLAEAWLLGHHIRDYSFCDDVMDILLTLEITIDVARALSWTIPRECLRRCRLYKWLVDSMVHNEVLWGKPGSGVVDEVEDPNWHRYDDDHEYDFKAPKGNVEKEEERQHFLAEFRESVVQAYVLKMSTNYWKVGGNTWEVMADDKTKYHCVRERNVECGCVRDDSL